MLLCYIDNDTSINSFIQTNLSSHFVSTDSPSPDKYNLGSVFDCKESSPKNAFGQPKKSFVFGAGREHFNKTVYNMGTMYPDAIVPGPGSYTDGTKLIGVNARKPTLKERKYYHDDESMARKLAIPGPGTYED
jgi:hypothetical protein